MNAINHHLKIDQIQEIKSSHILSYKDGQKNYSRYNIPINYRGYHSIISHIPSLYEGSLEDIKKQLQEVQKQSWHPAIHLISELLPQIRFAFSHINDQINDNPLIQKGPSRSIKFNKLITDFDHQDHELKDAKYIKIKIARHNPDREIESLLSLAQKYPRAKWRLDANQNLTVSDLLYYWKGISSIHDKIDYFEEPFESLSHYLQIPSSLALPYGHDELAREYLKEKKTSPQALIIKPSAFGSIDETLTLKKTSTRIVLSHSYEPKLLHSTILQMANNWPTEYHGLDYYNLAKFNIAGE